MDQGSTVRGLGRVRRFYYGLIDELLDYAEHEFSISKPDKNGTSQREHLLEVQRQTGKTPKELEGPPFPTLVSHIWSAFIALSSARSMGMSGPDSLSYTEIKNWMDVTNNRLSARDVEALKSLDVIYLTTRNAK